MLSADEVAEHSTLIKVHTEKKGETKGEQRESCLAAAGLPADMTDTMAPKQTLENWPMKMLWKAFLLLKNRIFTRTPKVIRMEIIPAAKITVCMSGVIGGRVMVPNEVKGSVTHILTLDRPAFHCDVSARFLDVNTPGRRSKMTHDCAPAPTAGNANYHKLAL